MDYQNIVGDNKADMEPLRKQGRNIKKYYLQKVLLYFTA